MVDIPGLKGSIDLNPFNNDEPDTTQERRRKLAEQWDGRGAPPSREVAVAWLIENTTWLNRREAEAIVGTSGTLTKVGQRVRTAVLWR